MRKIRTSSLSRKPSFREATVMVKLAVPAGKYCTGCKMLRKEGGFCLLFRERLKINWDNGNCREEVKVFYDRHDKCIKAEV